MFGTSNQRPQNTPDVDVKIFVTAALVHTFEDPKIATTNVKTFKDYAECALFHIPRGNLYMLHKYMSTWDAYKTDSLKAHTRECRSTGQALSNFRENMTSTQLEKLPTC